MNMKLNRPKTSIFPLYCFDIEITNDRIMFRIPIQMRMDDKKFNTVEKEIKKILKPYGYSECGGGTGFDGYYDMDYIKTRTIKKKSK